MYIFDILIYIIFAFLMYLFAEQGGALKNDKVKPSYIWAYIVFYTIIVAIRWNVGADSLGYLEMFRNSSYVDDHPNEELLWNYWLNTVHRLGLHFTIGLALTGFLQIFFIVKGVKEAKYLLLFIPVALFGGRYFVMLNNGVRQMIVACAFFYFAKYIVEKKPLPYFLFVVVAMQIHHSAMMLAPFYFLPSSLRLADRRVINMTIFLGCFVLGQTPVFQDVIKYVEGITDFLGYSNHTDYIVNKLSDAKSYDTLSFGPIMLSFLLIPILIIWYAPLMGKLYREENKLFDLWFNFSFFYASAYWLICNISHFFIRPVTYFAVFELTMISLLLYTLSKKQSEISIGKFKYFIVLIIVWTTTIWGCIKVSGEKPIDESTTYKVYWNHID